MTDHLDRRPNYLQVADQLRDRIWSGQWRATHKLPSEARLIVQFGVSRTTVRQAVAVLRAEGLVVTRQGLGSFVRDREPTGQVSRLLHGRAPGPAMPDRPPTIRIHELVRARMPTPHEMQKFNLTTGVPVLVVSRQVGGGPRSPSAAEPAETVLPADRAVLEYVIDLDDLNQSMPMSSDDDGIQRMGHRS